MPRPSSPARTQASGPQPFGRRSFLAGSTALGAAVVGGTAFGVVAPASAAPARRLVDPFTLGVASGDPTPGGVVLWTRLAPAPLEGGGMPDRFVPVAWQVATDERFRDVVASGAEVSRPELGHSVHVEVEGLRPGAEYFYRFRAGDELSPVGRTRTAPEVGAPLDRLAFGLTSCQNYQAGLFTAHRRMAEDDLDLVVQVGDYIYEGAPSATAFRRHEGAGEPFSLVEYRNRHAQYKADADLQAAHAACAWAVVLDDHEIDNNWADEVPQDPERQPRDVFLARRAAAFQAYWEHMPLRRSSLPRGIDVQLYRRLTFGDLLDVHLLDTRQYRSDQAAQSARLDPQRTILGDEQEAWLERALAGPTARWNALAQQVFFSQRDFASGDALDLSTDAWDGYVADRDGLRDHLAAVGTSNPVVLTGDVHANYLCDVKADFDDPDSRTVATEVVGTSTTSGGDGRDQNPGDAVQLAENPHIKLINRNRGYVRNVVTPATWTIDYRVVDSVTVPGAPVRTRASYVVEDGRPGGVPA